MTSFRGTILGLIVVRFPFVQPFKVAWLELLLLAGAHVADPTRNDPPHPFANPGVPLKCLYIPALVTFASLSPLLVRNPWIVLVAVVLQTLLELLGPHLRRRSSPRNPMICPF